MKYNDKEFDQFLRKRPKQEALTKQLEDSRLYDSQLGAGGYMQPYDVEDVLSEGRINSGTFSGRFSGTADGLSIDSLTVGGEELSLNGGESFITSVTSPTGSESTHTHTITTATTYGDSDYGIMYTLSRTAQGAQQELYMYGQYDFAADGGVIGTINLAGENIPDDSVIMAAWYRVRTTLTSATDAATIALTVESANDLVSAIAINNGTNPWDAAGWIECIPKVEDSTTFIETTAARALNMVIAVENLTAGKIDVMVKFLRLNATTVAGNGVVSSTTTSPGTAHNHSITAASETKYLVKYTP